MRKDAEKKKKEEEAYAPSVGPYTMNPLFVADAEKEKHLETQTEMTSAAAGDGAVVERISTVYQQPLHRPSSNRFATMDEDEDDEYDSIAGVNPLHQANPMAMPSIKDKKENEMRNRTSEQSL